MNCTQVKTPSLIRQGDVLLVPVVSIPDGCKEVPYEGGRIVLMHGEVTGHAHAISDHINNTVSESSAGGWAEAGNIAMNAIARASSRARLLEAPDGVRYLEVNLPVTLRHEEHTAHVIPKGLYDLPVQMEHTAERMRQVRD
jgi:hypothetical protein